MQRILFLLLALLFTSIVYVSCTKKNAEREYPDLTACDTSGITYSGYIASFVSSNCGGSSCHTNGGSGAGVNLDTYSGLKKIADNGELMGTINHQSGYKAMPDGRAKLDNCTIAKVQVWVTAGAQNN